MFDYSLRNKIKAESQPFSNDFVASCFTTIRNDIDRFNENDRKELEDAWAVLTKEMKVELVRFLVSSVSGLCSQCTQNRDNNYSDAYVRAELQLKFDFLNKPDFIKAWVIYSSDSNEELRGQYRDWMKNARQKLIPLPVAEPMSILHRTVEDRESWGTMFYRWWHGIPKDSSGTVVHAGVAQPVRPCP